MLVAALAVVVVLRATHGGGASGAEPRPVAIGLVANTLGFGADLDRGQDLVEATGVRWIREELHWRLIEPQRGVRTWDAIDRLMAASARRRLTVLPLLNDAPGWAGDGSGGLPTDAAAYGAFVAAAVARYGPGGTFWRAHPDLPAERAPRWFELWNEPYYAPPIGSAVTAARYAALADAGLRAGREANDAARFTVALDASYDGDPLAPGRWLAQVEAASPRLVERADGVVAHPYAATPDAVLDKVRRLRAELDARGVERPIWLTEVGWSTCPAQEDGRCVSEAQQAAALGGLLRRVDVLPRDEVPAVFLYSLHDLPGTPPSFESHFGILRLDGSRKPAWQVVHASATRR